MLGMAGINARRRHYSKQQALRELRLAIRELVSVLLSTSSAVDEAVSAENGAESVGGSASWAAATGENGWAREVDPWFVLPKVSANVSANGGGGDDGDDGDGGRGGRGGYNNRKVQEEWVAAGHVVLLVHRVQQLLQSHSAHFEPRAKRWLRQDIDSLKCAEERTSQLEILRLMAADLSGSYENIR
jgi:hypothetical protein